MVKLDIRQESSRHSDVLDTITNYLGLGSYKYDLMLLITINIPSSVHPSAWPYHMQTMQAKTCSWSPCILTVTSVATPSVLAVF